MYVEVQNGDVQRVSPDGSGVLSSENRVQEGRHLPYVRRDAAEIYFEAHGDGPAILLTHGFAESADMWRGQIEPLACDHTVIVWDMRGHGRTRCPDASRYSREETVADMCTVLDAAGFERAVIGGLSLGGYMSLAFQRAHPDRTSALMIVDSGPGYRQDESRNAWNARAIGTAERHEAKAREGDAEALGLAHAARGMLTQVDSAVIDSLASVRAPALIIVGENDLPYRSNADYMERKIPSSVKRAIERAGHLCDIDEPDKFNAIALEFLKSLR
jgi:pimeloyl-ACP methyl ester carboxylesterase